MSGEKTRKRSATFADHYSQARLFFRSQTPVEQAHIEFFEANFGKLGIMHFEDFAHGIIDRMNRSMTVRRDQFLITEHLN